VCANGGEKEGTHVHVPFNSSIRFILTPAEYQKIRAALLEIVETSKDEHAVIAAIDILTRSHPY
jgi:hypothetical protein